MPPLLADQGRGEGGTDHRERHSGGGGERRPIGEEVREQLEYVPGSLIVLEHARLKYPCKC